jgi:coenzyme F420 biosynthesis associated uncharacterized protein
MPARSMIDWDLAVSTASRLAGPGPTITRPDADAVVAELRADAARSTGLVREFTGLDAPAGSELTAPVLVVDRTGWVQANVDAFADLVGPLIEQVRAKRGKPSGVTDAIGSKVTGLEVGGLLGFMSSKVLGQFDPFYAGPAADGVTPSSGRLLLVAPNIVHVEQELHVDQTDFRLWVCLHEETHRVQFTAVPWMRDHLFSEFGRLADTVEPQRLLDEGFKRISEAIRNGHASSLIDLMGSPEQKAILDRVTGVMSLLEGHADFVMDGVGPSVIPSVGIIRGKFDERRKGVGTLDRLLRKLLGLEAKMAQYRDGASFVRAVVDKVGMDGFNAVWATPDHLPTLAEIHDPDSWVGRVHP